MDPDLKKERSEENRKKILIVENDETTARILKRLLIQEGFQVAEAKNGLGAVEQLKTEPPSMVLTELKLPSFSGIDLIQFIHQKMKDIPIVVMTAYPHLCPRAWKRDKIRAFFVKPFDIDEMFSSIRSIFGINHSCRERRNVE